MRESRTEEIKAYGASAKRGDEVGNERNTQGEEGNCFLVSVCSQTLAKDEASRKHDGYHTQDWKYENHLRLPELKAATTVGLLARPPGLVRFSFPESASKTVKNPEYENNPNGTENHMHPSEDRTAASLCARE
jgi:hypothetical protein